MNSNQQKNQHLWWRAGFGPPASQVRELSRVKPDNLFHSILKASEKNPEPLVTADSELVAMLKMDKAEADPRRRLTPEQRQMFRRQSVTDIAKLNILWLKEMTESPAQLLEKTALFWHGHFASKTVNIIYDQELLAIIRQSALGNFRDLLHGVSKSASMLSFLNNNQNKKAHPNENFARELMELFTIGRGFYSESDVKEAARSFTGWGTDGAGNFDFRIRQHDEGIKTFMGKTGNLTGEEVIDILLAQKQTARFITRKIYVFFVNDHIADERLNELSKIFFDSNYDISLLLTKIFTSSWFYDAENIGTQIKSPVLWLVGMRRQLPMELKNPEVQIVLERLLGQVLFAPPNVAGWPGGKHWISSSSLMLRLQIPAKIYQSDAVLSKPKDDDDLMMGMKDQALRTKTGKGRKPNDQFFQAVINWDTYSKNFQETKEPAVFDAIRDLLLQRITSMGEGQMLRYVDETNREKRIQSITIRLMGTPEYQLC